MVEFDKKQKKLFWYIDIKKTRNFLILVTMATTKEHFSFNLKDQEQHIVPLSGTTQQVYVKRAYRITGECRVKYSTYRNTG